MAPSAAQLKEALIKGTREVYSAEPDGTSVNKVRRHVEEKLGLDDSFFTSEAWKQKSKTIIKEQVDKLLEEDASEPKYESDSKVGIKRQSSEIESPQPKRRKKTSGPAKKKEESDVDEAPKKESSIKSKKLVSRRKAEADDSDDQGTKLEESPSPARNRKRSKKEESEDELKHDASSKGNSAPAKKQETPGGEIKPSVKAQPDSGAEEAKPDAKDEPQPEVNEEDEYSDQLKKDATPDDPKDAEIKKLQSQLAKCGIRKLWHIELKQHGDNAGAKIRHLKKMLADIGMDGRFSEAKAREIKEMRELQADVEAAQEMDRLWGTSSGGRASRSKAKTATQEAKLESEEENEDDDNDEPTSFAARRRKAHADLAFLGDESDSD
ncbi:hypothetical protein TrVGV298_004056 [Trichoderma virens]|nr:hypothetical protein TrVGV298_004056 [Trichoderma virens]